MARENYVGKVFGRLTVVEHSGFAKNRNSIYKRKCECGNEVFVRRSNLASGQTKSCGCYRKECNRASCEKLVQTNACGHVNNTSLSLIASSKPYKTNTSGVKGVFFDKGRRKWRAFIEFQHKRTYLGSFADIEDAKKARKRAEEEMYWPELVRNGIRIREV